MNAFDIAVNAYIKENGSIDANTYSELSDVFCEGVMDTVMSRLDKIIDDFINKMQKAKSEAKTNPKNAIKTAVSAGNSTKAEATKISKENEKADTPKSGTPTVNESTLQFLEDLYMCEAAEKGKGKNLESTIDSSIAKAKSAKSSKSFGSKIAALIMAATIATSCTGCATVEGMGKDLSAAGQAISDTVSNVVEDISDNDDIKDAKSIIENIVATTRSISSEDDADKKTAQMVSFKEDAAKFNKYNDHVRSSAISEVGTKTGLIALTSNYDAPVGLNASGCAFKGSYDSKTDSLKFLVCIPVLLTDKNKFVIVSQNVDFKSSDTSDVEITDKSSGITFKITFGSLIRKQTKEGITSSTYSKW